VPVLRLDTGNQGLCQRGQLIGGLGDPILDAVHAFPVAEFASIEPGAAAGAVRQAFGTGLGADVECVLQAAGATGVTTHQRPLECPFDREQRPRRHHRARREDPEDQGETEAQTTIELAVPLLEQAAGGPVESMIGVPEPLAAIQDAINIHGFDELIISTLPQRVSKWLKLDLPSKAAGLGLPVTTVIASGREQHATA